jgi:hypothetical protein
VRADCSRSNARRLAGARVGSICIVALKE